MDPEALDLLSLAIQLASSRGEFVVFLGSGVSKAAGIPSGWDVHNRMLTELYIAATQDQDPLPPAVQEWAENEGLASSDYSTLIERVRPSIPDRTAYLRSMFVREGDDQNEEVIPPTKAHQVIACLARDGRVRRIVTTNFDPLMEDALREVGIQAPVLSTQQQCADPALFEHERCVVFKPHGHWADGVLRNTPAEVADLDPAMDAVLAELLSRNAIIVVGYHGWQNERVCRLLQERCSPYLLYWLACGQESEVVAELRGNDRCRVMRIESADEALRTLESRIEALSSETTVQSPEVLEREVRALILRGERPRLVDFCRRLRDSVTLELRSSLGDPRKETTARSLEDLAKLVLASIEGLARVGAVVIELDDAGTFDILLNDIAAHLPDSMYVDRQRSGSYYEWPEWSIRFAHVALVVTWSLISVHLRRWPFLSRLYGLPVKDGESSTPLHRCHLLRCEALRSTEDHVGQWLRTSPWFGQHLGAALSAGEDPVKGLLADHHFMFALWLSDIVNTDPTTGSGFAEPLPELWHHDQTLKTWRQYFRSDPDAARWANAMLHEPPEYLWGWFVENYRDRLLPYYQDRSARHRECEKVNWDWPEFITWRDDR